MRRVGKFEFGALLLTAGLLGSMASGARAGMIVS
jgi:hypothetical protein